MLPSVSPMWHQARQQNSHECSNPAIYVARYFGHIDQNEKIGALRGNLRSGQRWLFRENCWLGSDVEEE